MLSHNCQYTRVIIDGIPVTNTPGDQRIITGILSWLIPFLTAVLFSTRECLLLFDTALFKSHVIVTRMDNSCSP
jgi:hypothetical protein